MTKCPLSSENHSIKKQIIIALSRNYSYIRMIKDHML